MISKTHDVLKLFAFSNHLYLVSDESGIITYANETWEQFIGYSPEELIGQNYIKFILPDDLPLIPTKIEKHKLTEEITNYQSRWLSKDGETKYIKWYTVAQKDTQTNKNYYYSIAVDITQLEKAQNQLFATESKYASITESINYMVIEFDLNGKIVYAKNTEKIIGLTDFETTRQNINDILILFSGDETYLSLDHILEIQDKVSYQSSITNLNNEMFFVENTFTPVTSIIGVQTGYIMTSKEINNEKKLERILAFQSTLTEIAENSSYLEDALIACVRLIKDNINSDAAKVLLHTGNEEVLETYFSINLSESYLKETYLFDLASNFGKIILKNHITYTNLTNIDKTPFYNELIKEGLRNYVSIPIRIDGKVKIIFLFYYKYLDNIPDFYKNIIEAITPSLENTLRRIHTNERLLEGEKLYQSLVNNHMDLILRITIDGRIKYLNPMVSYLLERNYKELIDTNAINFIHNNDIEKSKFALGRVLATGKDSTIVNRINTPTGLKWIYWIIATIADRTGGIGEIQLVGRDITQLKTVEAELKTSKKRIDLLLSSISDGFMSIDSNGKIDYINGRALEIFRIPNSDISPEEFRKYLKSMFEVTFVNFFYMFLSKKVDGQTEIFCKKSGKWFVFYFYPFANGTSILISDITKQKEAEKELKLYSQKLEESNQELQNFAYVASHDLQEPLRMVASFTQLLEKKYSSQLDDKAKEYIRFATEGASRMRELINNLLDYSRVTTQAKPFTELNLNDIANKALQNLKVLIDDSNAAISCNRLPIIDGDETQIIRVFQNIIGNAIKYRKKDIIPQIKITCSEDKTNYIVAIEDNGIGFDTKYSGKIFKIFSRLHTKEEYEGTGIGLSICKKIVERHNGFISVESQLELGSVFKLHFPKRLVYA